MGFERHTKSFGLILQPLDLMAQYFASHVQLIGDLQTARGMDGPVPAQMAKLDRPYQRASYKT